MNQTITCNCKVHKGAKAEVPAGMLEGGDQATIAHNLVSVAWSPLGGLGSLSNVKRVS